MGSGAGGSGRGGGGGAALSSGGVTLRRGDFVTDGVVRGLVTGTGSIGTGRNVVPGFSVDLGGGRRGFMLAQQIRRIG